MKPGELVIVVDTVEEAVKFYTEKLAFDIVELQQDEENKRQVAFARLKKGKCFIVFRKPQVEELAEFSFIKRCASRSICLHVEMKNGVDKYFERCKKKGLDPKGSSLSFSLRDPFGIKLIFCKTPEKAAPKLSLDFFGLPIKKSDVGPQTEASLLNKMSAQLKNFGILRRSSKKYAKLVLKGLVK